MSFWGCRCCAVDGAHVRKVNELGNQEWVYDHGVSGAYPSADIPVEVRDMDWDSDGNLVLCGTPANRADELNEPKVIIRAIDTDGQLVYKIYEQQNSNLSGEISMVQPFSDGSLLVYRYPYLMRVKHTSSGEAHIFWETYLESNSSRSNVLIDSGDNIYLAPNGIYDPEGNAFDIDFNVLWTATRSFDQFMILTPDEQSIISYNNVQIYKTDISDGSSPGLDVDDNIPFAPTTGSVHIHDPKWLDVDSGGNIYVAAEKNTQRGTPPASFLFKFNSNVEQQWYFDYDSVSRQIRVDDDFASQTYSLPGWSWSVYPDGGWPQAFLTAIDFDNNHVWNRYLTFGERWNITKQQSAHDPNTGTLYPFFQEAGGSGNSRKFRVPSIESSNGVENWSFLHSRGVPPIVETESFGYPISISSQSPVLHRVIMDELTTDIYMCGGRQQA